MSLALKPRSPREHPVLGKRTALDFESLNIDHDHDLLFFFFGKRLKFREKSVFWRDNLFFLKHLARCENGPLPQKGLSSKSLFLALASALASSFVFSTLLLSTDHVFKPK